MPLLPLDILAEFFPGVTELPGTLAPRTVTEYRRDAAHYAAFCGFDKARILDGKSLQAWRRHMIDHTQLSPHTINRRLRAIKKLVQVSVRYGGLDETLLLAFGRTEGISDAVLRERLKPSRLPISARDMRALCRAPDPCTRIGVRDRALLHTMASSGCRISEVVALERASLVQTAQAWTVRVWGKGQSQERLAPLSGEAYLWIMRWLEVRKLFTDCPLIFTGFNTNDYPNGHGLSDHAAWRRVKFYAARIGRPDISPHDFRKFVGTQLTEKAGIRQAQRALGHASIETTARHYVLDQLKPGLTENLY